MHIKWVLLLCFSFGSHWLPFFQAIGVAMFPPLKAPTHCTMPFTTVLPINQAERIKKKTLWTLYLSLIKTRLSFKWTKQIKVNSRKFNPLASGTKQRDQVCVQRTCPMIEEIQKRREGWKQLSRAGHLRWRRRFITTRSFSLTSLASLRTLLRCQNNANC